jgi:hypothetical protein
MDPYTTRLVEAAVYGARGGLSTDWQFDERMLAEHGG